MADADRREFRHADLGDRFILVGNLVFALVRNIGIGFFGAAVLAVPLILAVMVVRPLRELGSRVSGEAFTAALFVGIFIAAAALTWVRVLRLRRNRFVVDANGIEIVFVPWQHKRVAWSDILTVHENTDPDDPDSPNDLVFDTTRGRIKVDSENWVKWEITQAVAKHVNVLSLAQWQAQTGKRS